jgi:hypothetical protein
VAGESRLPHLLQSLSPRTARLGVYRAVRSLLFPSTNWWTFRVLRYGFRSSTFSFHEVADSQFHYVHLSVFQLLEEMMFRDVRQ